MKNKFQAKQLKLNLIALSCGSLIFACSHNDTPVPATTEISNTELPLITAEQSKATLKLAPDREQESTLDAEEPLLRELQGASQLSELQQQPRFKKHAIRTTMPMPVAQDLNRDRYANIDSNPIKRVSEQPISTFSLDVDTGSYAIVRRHIQHGQLPPADAVRTEELINYFNYETPSIDNKKHPFAFTTELATAPWHKQRQLLRVSLAAWQQPMQDLPPSNLVFLVDVSGSMQAADKLPLLKSSLKMLVQQMRAQDSVSLVTYAGSSAVVLEPTRGSEKRRIINAIDALGAGGGTHGAAGLKDAYRLAAQHKIEGGINRVMLATDGDFNVGMSDTKSLLQYIRQQRKTGISLTTLGFGQGNYNDHLMEQLADNGDGNHAYIDTLSEARKVLMEQVGATLYTVAQDAKIQVEFNPAQVSEYRLLGYENRLLKEQDFNDDKVDAGDIGAGHTVTALYEIALHGSGGERMPKRRYAETQSHGAENGNELAWLKLRYKPRNSQVSTLLEQKISSEDLAPASADFKFASSVAAWGDWLRQSSGDSDYTIEQIIELAEAGKGADRQAYRREYIQLLKLSATMRSSAAAELASQ